MTQKLWKLVGAKSVKIVSFNIQVSPIINKGWFLKNGSYDFFLNTPFFNAVGLPQNI
jgi:hypothetical protein